MNPSERRLLLGISRALEFLRAADRPAEERKAMAGVDLALAELLLRHDEVFMSGQLRAGHALAARVGADAAAMPGTIPDMTQLLEGLTRRIAGAASEPGAGTWLGEVVDWENALHARRQAPLPETLPETSCARQVFSSEALGRYLARRHPHWGTVRVDEVEVMSGGFSKTTVMFDAHAQTSGDLSLVLRAEQQMDLIFLRGARIANEYHVLRYVHRAGLPVAEPLWLEQDVSIFGAPFLVSRRLTGRNLGDRVAMHARMPEQTLRSIVAELARIHALALDWSDSDLAASHLRDGMEFRTLTGCIAAQIAYWTREAASFDLAPSPILTRALAWLGDHVPQNDAPPVFLHGDYGLHNIMVDEPGRVCGILDWEACGIGDPADDLVWLAGGLAAQFPRAQIVSLYEEVSGRSLSPQRLHYFDVMTSVRFAVTCARALFLFEQNESVDLGALQLGLIYMHHGTAMLNRAIEAAEAG